MALLVSLNMTWSQHLPGFLGLIAALISLVGLISCVLYATRVTHRSSQ